MTNFDYLFISEFIPRMNAQSFFIQVSDGKQKSPGNQDSSSSLFQKAKDIACRLSSNTKVNSKMLHKTLSKIYTFHKHFILYNHYRTSWVKKILHLWFFLVRTNFLYSVIFWLNILPRDEPCMCVCVSVQANNFNNYQTILMKLGPHNYKLNFRYTLFF